MAYGNYAPFYRGGYFNPMTPQMPMAENQGQFAQPFQQPIQTQQTNDTMLWVLNETEASSYPVAPNNSVVLWDKNQKTFYIKTANAQGIPSMQIYDFTERPQNSPQTPTEHVCKCGDNFVTKEEFKALQGKYDEIMGKLEQLEENPKVKTTKTAKGDVE
jgi:hypothetical protein